MTIDSTIKVSPKAIEKARTSKTEFKLAGYTRMPAETMGRRAVRIPPKSEFADRPSTFYVTSGEFPLASSVGSVGVGIAAPVVWSNGCHHEKVAIVLSAEWSSVTASL